MEKVELLAPAGDLEKLKIAVTYGADAVYLGGTAFGLRAGAGNFTLEELKEGLEYAHARGAKVYVTVNIIPHNAELKELPEYLRELWRLKVDGLIISDPGVMKIAQQVAPGIPIHLSTQANTTNWRAAQFWFGEGVKRIVLARELSLEEIREIRDRTEGELEVFVHGAMCISYSGRCLLSNFMAHRDANRGECAHPCRWKYYLVEEKRPGEYYPIVEEGKGTFIFNSHDLCLIEHLPALINVGVNSLKIEGRMKSVYYVAVVVGTYRQALDAYYADPLNYRCNPRWLEELRKVSHRDYTTGFLYGPPGPSEHNYESSSYIRGYDFVGKVLNYYPKTHEALIEQRNRILTGDKVEIMGPKGIVFEQEIRSMKNEEGETISSAPHAQQKIVINVDRPVAENYLLRRAREV